MVDCIFCKIVQGEIPVVKLMEDKLNLAFLDARPRSPGHTLVIPKKHYEKLEDMPEEEAKEFFGFMHKLTKAVPGAVNAQGFNLGVNNGKAAGQEVMHVHFNIIPRFEEDQGSPIQGLVQVEVKEDPKEIAKRIKENLPAEENKEEEKREEKKEQEKKKEKDEEKPTKSSEREWQEFNLKEQDKAADYSDARREY